MTLVGREVFRPGDGFGPASRAVTTDAARAICAVVISRVKISIPTYAARPPEQPLTQSVRVRSFVPTDFSTIPIATAAVSALASGHTSVPIRRLKRRRQTHMCASV